MSEFDRKLLIETLEYVSTNVPFYAGVRKTVGSSRELTLDDFPLIDRTTVVENFERFLHLDRFPDFVISSGGTSMNAGAFSFRCQEEYEAVHYYMSAKDPRSRFEPDPPAGFSLDIFNNSNGYHWRKPPGWPTLAITLEQQAHADLILRLMRDGIRVKGQRMCVKHVQGQCGPMRALTGYFHESGVHAPSDDLSTVLVLGSHTTKVWKRRFQDVWGVAIHEMYGLSEFTPGTALKCTACESFHFWTCWPEFLGLGSDEPVAAGDARLVLTSLVPFVRLQPRIRYFTGDIVTLNGICAKSGRMGFSFRGRASSSVVTGQGLGRKVLFSEIEVLEALEQMPGVAHQMHVCEKNIWETAQVPKPDYAMGYPRYRLTAGEDGEGVAQAKLTVEVTFDFEHDRVRRKIFIDQLDEHLKREVPGLERALSVREVLLDVTLATVRDLRLWVKSSA